MRSPGTCHCFGCKVHKEPVAGMPLRNAFLRRPLRAAAGAAAREYVAAVMVVLGRSKTLVCWQFLTCCFFHEAA